METGWVPTGSPEGFPEWAGQMPALPQVPPPQSCGWVFIKCPLHVGLKTSALGRMLLPLCRGTQGLQGGPRRRPHPAPGQVWPGIPASSSHTLLWRGPGGTATLDVPVRTSGRPCRSRHRQWTRPPPGMEGMCVEVDVDRLGRARDDAAPQLHAPGPGRSLPWLALPAQLWQPQAPGADRAPLRGPEEQQDAGSPCMRH